MNANFDLKEYRVVEAYSAAKSAAEFAQLLGVTQKTAWHWRNRLNLAPIPHSGRIRHKHADQVCELFTAGKQLTEIATELGMTRGQVAGIVNRAGLFKKREKVARPRGPSKKHLPDRLITRPKFRKETFRRNISAAPFLGVPLLERKFDQCAYPDPHNFDPREPKYCGQPVFESKRYCEACCSVMYQPPQARTRNPRPRP
jgi:hypothetical protein